MSLLSPGLVLPLTPPADPHLFLDDPFFEQTRHHFDLTVKQMSNRWSLNSPDHLSPFRSLHQNNVDKEDSSEPGTKQHKIIQIQVEAEDDDDTAEKSKTKDSFSNRPQSSTAETSTASESSSSQGICNQNKKTLVAGELTEKEKKSSSLGGGLSLHRKLLPTLHQDPFFDDSFFRDVQSDFEETFDSILKDHNAKATSKKLEEHLSIPEEEVVNEIKAKTEEESTSDYQKDAVSEQVARGCDSNVKGGKCLVEEGQGSRTCAGSAFTRTSRPRPSLSGLMRHSAIDKSLSLDEVHTNEKEKDDKGCQDATRILPVDDEDKTDHVNEAESSHEVTDEDSEMKINEDEHDFLLSDEENQLTNLHLESSLDTIIEEPSTPMQELKEDKDIFKQELCNEQQNEHDIKEQDSNSNTLTLSNSELLKQDSDTEPSVVSPTILSQKSDQSTSLPKKETLLVSSPQEPKYILLRETDHSGVSPAKLEAASSPLSNSLKPDKLDILDIIKRSSRAQKNIVKDENLNEVNEKTLPEESEEKPSTSHYSQQTSPQSKRNSRVRFEDLPEASSEQQKQNSKTQEDDNQNTPCIKEHSKEKKDQDRKNKRLHLFIPEIKISGVQYDDSVPLELENTSDHQKSPQDLKSLEQSLEREENQQKIVQAPTSENKTSVSSKRVRTESMNSTLSESSDISKPESYSIVNSSKKESQEDFINKNDFSTKKQKNDAAASERKTCTSAKTMLTPTNTKEGELPIQRRGSFFRDSTFKDDHKHFRSAVSKVLERFGIRSSADNELNAYKTLRQWISVGESQAAKFIDGKTTYKVVLDMSEFTSVKAKIDGQILVIEGLPLGKEANSNQISRRCFIFPTSVEMGSVTSALSSDGVLTVTGPKRRRHSHCQEDAIR